MFRWSVCESALLCSDGVCVRAPSGCHGCILCIVVFAVFGCVLLLLQVCCGAEAIRWIGCTGAQVCLSLKASCLASSLSVPFCQIDPWPGVRFPKASLANYGRNFIAMSIELYW